MSHRGKEGIRDVQVPRQIQHSGVDSMLDLVHVQT